MRRFIHGILGAGIVIAVSLVMSCVMSSPADDPDRCERTNNGYFRISSPLPGRTIQPGDRDSIAWLNESLANDSMIRISLYKGVKFVDTIGTRIRNGAKGGFLAWTVPPAVSGADYRIRITEASDTSHFDMGCSFGISSGLSGSLSFVKPEAGAVCTTGGNLEIQWQKKGTPGDSVSLVLCNDSTMVKIIIARTANSGAFTWKVAGGLATKSSYRIKITSLFDPGITSLSPFFSIVKTGAGGDAYEPDNTPEAASAIDSLGKTYTHSLTQGDIDWIKFKADSGVAYILRIGGVGGADFYYGKDTVFTMTFITSPTAPGSSIPWTCIKSGFYYLKFVATKDSTDDYTIAVVRKDAEKTLVFLAPTASTIWNTGSSQTILWTPDSSILGKSANLYLVKGSQRIGSLATGVANSGTVPVTVDSKLESGSDYRVLMVNAADTGKGGISELFTIQGCSPDSLEPDNTRDKASKAVVNGKGRNHTLAVGDTDWVGFAVDSGKTYRLLSSGSITPVIALFFGADASISMNGAWTASGVNVISLKWACTKGGIWYARITPQPSASGCGAYAFEIADMDSVVQVAFSSPTAGASWSAGSTQQIRWTADTTFLGSYVAIALYKGQTPYYSIIGATFNSGVYNWTLPTGILTGNDYRVKIVSYVNGSQGGMSPAFTITGMTADAFEPDGKRDSASTLALGKSQSHTLPLNDTDWVKFPLDSGSTYMVQNSGNASMYTYLYFGGDVSYTTYFYNSSAGNIITYRCPKGGTWYARVTAYSSASGGSYVFNVAKLDTLAMVSFTSPTQGASWNSGSSYQIQWSPDSVMLGPYVSLYLYKGAQQVTSLYQGMSNSGVYTWYIPSYIMTGSDYRIKLVNYNRASLYGYSPTFTINGLTPDAFEFDGVRDSAKAFSPLGKAQAHTLGLNDTDWVKFSADSGKSYAIQTSGTMNTRIYLYYGSEQSVSSSFYGYTNSTTTTWTCWRGGEWYARITSNYSSGGGTYSFNIIPFDSLPPVTFTSPTSASTWAAGSAVTIQWSPDSIILGSYVQLSLYKGSREIQYITDCSNSGSVSWTVPGGIGSGSDYQIYIYNTSNSTFGGRSQPFSITGVASDSFEVDDTMSKAKAIPTDGTVHYRTLALGDADWISFTAQKDSTYLLAARSEDASLSNFVGMLYGSSPEFYMAYSAGQNPKIVWTCTQSGNYYFLLQSDYTYYGKYSVSIKNCSSGFAVTFANPTDLSIWSAGSAYSIQWTPDTALFGQYVELQLAVDTTVVRTITTSARNNGSYSWSVPAGMATGSKYSIKLSSTDYPQLFGRSAAFTISGINPDAYEPDDSAAIAHPIATTGTAESHTLASNDKDWCSFSAAANNLYIIKTTGATSSMSTQLTLYGTDAKTLISTARSATSDSTATITMFCQTAGTYYLRTISSTVGTYQIAVNGYDSTKYGLTIAAPAAGDTLTVGQVDTITWTSQATTSGNVDVYLNNASGVVLTIAANVANGGSRVWTVPSTITAGSGYYIRIISRFNSHIYGTSGTFTIK